VRGTDANAASHHSPLTTHAVPKKRILVAGVGNIFFGDDAFGCEVAKELALRSLPGGVTVRDFGIRSYDLAYAIMEHEATIIVDTSARGQPPGTVYLIEPNLIELDDAPGEAVNAHRMNPVRVLQLVRSFGGAPRPLFVVGCEPEYLEFTGELGLGEKVRAAIPAAIEMIEKLVADLRTSETFVAARQDEHRAAADTNEPGKATP
jgi:hydrogenase maturation protease